MENRDDIRIMIDTCASARIELRGEVDIDEARRLSEVLRDLVARVPLVQVDVAAVTFFGSAGLTALVTGLIEAREAGHVLRLVAVTDQIRRLLDVTGLTDDLAPEPAPG